MNEKRERGTGRLFQRGNTWWVQYYHHGEQIRVSAKTTDESKAKKILLRKMAEVLTDTHKDTRRLTYEEMRESYFQDYQTNKRKSLCRNKDGETFLPHVSRLNGFFEGYLAREIDADLIRKFIADQQAKGLSNGSINRSVSSLRRMFHLALEDGKLRDLPTFPMLQEAVPRQGYFERADYEKLFAALPQYLRLPLALGYYSGMRRGEVLSLEWSQVDFLRGVIHLLQTKNGHPRDLPVVSQLRTLLLEQHAKRQPQCPFVCYRLDNKGVAVRIKGLRVAWENACVRIGLATREPVMDADGKPEYLPLRGPRSKPVVKTIYRGRTYHDLRRTGVRNLIRAGISETVAMRISGHETASVFKRYDITSGKDFVEAREKLEQFHSQEQEKLRVQFGDNLPVQ